MDDVAQVRKVGGGTVNDVVLTVCGAALKAYLARHGYVPTRALVAAMPVSLRTEAHAGRSGNAVSLTMVSLATHIDDPCARHAEIIRNTRLAKERERQLRSGELLSDWVSLIRPVLGMTLGRVVSDAVRTFVGGNRAPCSVAISNITGPPSRMYMAAMVISAVYPLGPIVDGVPLNITVLSYIDTLHVGFVACPRTIPDLDTFAELLREALDELVLACVSQ